MIPLNRDRNGATNIGNNFKRLFGVESPIHELSEDDNLAVLSVRFENITVIFASPK